MIGKDTNPPATPATASAASTPTQASVAQTNQHGTTASSVAASVTTANATTVAAATVVIADNKDTKDNNTAHHPISTVVITRNKDESIEAIEEKYPLQNGLYVRTVETNSSKTQLQVCNVTETEVYAKKCFEDRIWHIYVMPNNHIFYHCLSSEGVLQVTDEVNAGVHNVAFNTIVANATRPSDGSQRDKSIGLHQVKVLQTGDMWIEFWSQPKFLRLTLEGFLTAYKKYQEICNALPEIFHFKRLIINNRAIEPWVTRYIKQVRDNPSNKHLIPILDRILAAAAKNIKIDDLNSLLFCHCVPADQLIASLDTSTIHKHAEMSAEIASGTDGVVTGIYDKLGSWRYDDKQSNEEKHTYLEIKEFQDSRFGLRSLLNSNQFIITHSSTPDRMKFEVGNFTTRDIAASYLIKSNARDPNSKQFFEPQNLRWLQPLSNGTTFVANLRLEEMSGEKGKEEVYTSDHIIFFDTVTQEAAAITHLTLRLRAGHLVKNLVQPRLLVLSDDSVVVDYKTEPEIYLYRYSPQSLVNFIAGAKRVLSPWITIEALIDIIAEYIGLIKNKVNVNDKSINTVSVATLHKFGGPVHAGSIITIEKLPLTVTAGNTAASATTNTAASATTAAASLPPPAANKK